MNALANRAEIERLLTPPRIAFRSPVSILKARAAAGTVFVVEDQFGHIVEVVNNHYEHVAEDIIFARWPWFSNQWSDRFGLPVSAQVFAMTVYVDNREYKRLCGLEPWSAHAAALREGALRRQRWCAVHNAVIAVWRWCDNGDYEHNPGALIYHRKDGVIEGHVRKVMFRLTKLGAVEMIGDPDAPMPNPKFKRGDTCMHYRPTDKLPDPIKVATGK